MTQVERNNAASTIREYAFGQMNMLRMLGDDEAVNNLQEAINMAVAALRGPQPDPDTWLVPCGCGGKAETHELFGEYSGTYMTDCKKCATGTTQYNTKKEAQDAWNTAMGWKGGAE